MKTTLVTIAAASLCAAGLLGANQLRHVLDRVDGLEERTADRAATRAEVIELESELGHELVGLTVELEGLRDWMHNELELTRENGRNDAESAESLGRGLELAQGALARLELELAQYGEQIAALSAREPDQLALTAELSALGQLSAGLEERCEELSASLVEAQFEASQAADRVEVLDQITPRPRDVNRMWAELVGPVVQLAGDSSVGSGVLLESVKDPEGEGYRTYLLTAWHVVRDIQGDLSNQDMPVPVTIYNPDGNLEHETAELLHWDASIDVALLRMRSQRRFSHGARLGSRERIQGARIFEPIYAVGCPLGNDPIPTAGEISSASHLVDGENYWMINAPTYIGNSGGGIFDGETYELLGIFSKIYNYGTIRPTIVPHMGLVTPLDRVYEWMDDMSVASLEPRSVDVQFASLSD